MKAQLLPAALLLLLASTSGYAAERAPSGQSASRSAPPPHRPPQVTRVRQAAGAKAGPPPHGTRRAVPSSTQPSAPRVETGSKPPSATPRAAAVAPPETPPLAAPTFETAFGAPELDAAFEGTGPVLEVSPPAVTPERSPTESPPEAAAPERALPSGGKPADSTPGEPLPQTVGTDRSDRAEDPVPEPDTRAPSATAPPSSLTPTTLPPAVPLTATLPPISELGPMSVGRPHTGFLVNGVPMPKGPLWNITVPQQRFATQETIDGVSHCSSAVAQAIAGTPPVMLGSFSAEGGGALPPHKSHRTGRDVDVYFFRKPGTKWFHPATREDLDLPRTWAMVRCFLTETEVDFVLIDQKPKGWLEEYALSIGEDPTWIGQMFHEPGRWPTTGVRHVPGHVAHMHVRFTSPTARRRAQEYQARLSEEGVLPLQYRERRYEVRAGDTLGQIAADHGTTAEQLQQSNHLATTLIHAGDTLLLQEALPVEGWDDPILHPARPPAPPLRPPSETGSVHLEAAPLASAPLPPRPSPVAPPKSSTPRPSRGSASGPAQKPQSPPPASPRRAAPAVAHGASGSVKAPARAPQRQSDVHHSTSPGGTHGKAAPRTAPGAPEPKRPAPDSTPLREQRAALEAIERGSLDVLRHPNTD